MGGFFKKSPELCPCEMSEELKAYILEHIEVQEVFLQKFPVEHDSSIVCQKKILKFSFCLKTLHETVTC